MHKNNKILLFITRIIFSRIFLNDEIFSNTFILSDIFERSEYLLTTNTTDNELNLNQN